MRKVIFLFIAFILVAVSIEWIHSCADLKSHKEVFGRYLTYAEMYEYKDKDYDYVVRVPSFFNAQPDSLQEEKGRMRFDYADQWMTLVIESHVMNSEGMSLQAGMANHKLWFVYTMIYPDDYKDILGRLFKEIDDWQIWERPHLQLKQGESQTPKAVSE